MQEICAVNMIFMDANACNLCVEMRNMQTWYATMQCNGKLYNVHNILSLFCGFDFDLIFFVGKHRLTVLLKEGIIHATLSYLLQISLGTPSKCMFCLI